MFCATCGVARADTTASLANALIVEQAIDIVQTQNELYAPRVAGQPRFVELDPFARPFVRSIPTLISSALALSFVAHTVPRHSSFLRGVLGVVVFAYPLVLFKNVRTRQARLSFRI